MPRETIIISDDDDENYVIQDGGRVVPVMRWNNLPVRAQQTQPQRRIINLDDNFSEDRIQPQRFPVHINLIDESAIEVNPGSAAVIGAPTYLPARNQFRHPQPSIYPQGLLQVGNGYLGGDGAGAAPPMYLNHDLGYHAFLDPAVLYPPIAGARIDQADPGLPGRMFYEGNNNEQVFDMPQNFAQENYGAIHFPPIPPIYDEPIEDFNEEMAMFDFNPIQNSVSGIQDDLCTRDSCIQDVLAVFPDICIDYVGTLYDNSNSPRSSEQIIQGILDDAEKGKAFPTTSARLKSLKRKRALDPEEEERKALSSVNRSGHGPRYNVVLRNILSSEFPRTPMTYIDAVLSGARNLLFPAYQVLEEAEQTWSEVNPPYIHNKSRRKCDPRYKDDMINYMLNDGSTDPPIIAAYRELKVARQVKKAKEEANSERYQAERAEEENLTRAIMEGSMSECGCCYDEFPINRMVHCESSDMHWFCRGCAKRSAEEIIVHQKHELPCLSTSSCPYRFDKNQQRQFLEKTSLIALERNEQQAALRDAGIENLETCPFCPYAAEYPPVEQNKEFRCESEDCERISCRLCRLDSHIPKTCEEHARDKAKEDGLSIRRQIEEAMSAALIRTCNKCKTPFVKEAGCNKMMCTQPKCRNIQCYVCSQSCGYDHFDDSARGGKAGNCPLFESVSNRHDADVEMAEKEALARVRAEHPEYTEEDLKVKMSDNVRQDEADRRKKEGGGGFPPRAPIFHPMPPQVNPGPPEFQPAGPNVEIVHHLRNGFQLFFEPGEFYRANF